MITPPQAHISCDLESKAGTWPKVAVGQPGAHGARVIGMQGMGVKTPIAAAVAAATVGLAGEVHIPNGVMLAIAWKSMMVAAGCLLVLTRLVGSTISAAGASPKVHCNEAPLQTC